MFKDAWHGLCTAATWYTDTVTQTEDGGFFLIAIPIVILFVVTMWWGDR